MLKQTPYGSIEILSKEEIFQKMFEALKDVSTKENPTVGLSGGSTPKAFYEWLIDSNSIDKSFLKNINWSTSDERCVPLTDPESNFGNADRMLLSPLGIDSKHKSPWQVDLTPEEAAKKHNENWGDNRPFDLCFLGMGDDCHTASIFPNSPLIKNNPSTLFAAVEVLGKGPRLTITPYGLKKCSKIIVTALGKGKADAIEQIFKTTHDPLNKPIQLLQKNSVWLLDSDAASKL